MSRIRSLFGIEERSFAPVDIPYSGGSWDAGMVWSGATSSAAVTTEQAMRLSAVFACLRLLSEAVASLPMDTFSREGGTRRPFRPQPDYLTFDPPQGSRIEYLSQVMLSLLTAGDAYVLTPRDRLGVPVDLIPLDPARVRIDRSSGKARCFVNTNEGEIELDPQLDVMHIKGMTLPGSSVGVSPIRYAAETVGLGLAAQRFGQSLFENGALPGAVLEAPGDMKQEAADRFRDSWNDRHRGIGNAHRVGVLTNGAKLKQVSINPDEAQFLETRKFQVPDVARVFGVPPHLIADASGSTSWGSGLAEQNLAFGQFSLRPWVDRIEEAHTRLLSTHGMSTVFVKLNMDALLRASLKDRYDSYAVGIQSQFLTRNEVRSLEDLPPVAGGDDFPDPPAGTPTGGTA